MTMWTRASPPEMRSARFERTRIASGPVCGSGAAPRAKRPWPDGAPLSAWPAATAGATPINANRTTNRRARMSFPPGRRKAGSSPVRQKINHSEWCLYALYGECVGQLAAYVAVVAVIVVLPGPDMALVLQNGVARGRRAALETALGIN